MAADIQPPLPVRSQAERGKGDVYNPHRAAKTLEETMELVKVNLAQPYGKQAKYYNRKRGSWQPVLGELVCKRKHPLSSAIDEFSAKLAEKFATGFTVTKIVGPSVYEVTNEGKIFTVHIKDLKPFHREPDREKPDLKKLNHEYLDRERFDHEQPEPDLDESLEPRRITRVMAKKVKLTLATGKPG